MKKMYTLSVIILMLLLITGCNNKNTENNSSERQKSDSSAEKEKGMENSSKKDIEDISGSFSEENRKILSVKQNFDGYLRKAMMKYMPSLIPSVFPP